jgi:hypothetical protein
MLVQSGFSMNFHTFGAVAERSRAQIYGADINMPVAARCYQRLANSMKSSVWIK